MNESCKLIVNLSANLEFNPGKHTLYRLKTLLEFIKTNRDRVDIVDASPYENGYKNLLILSDEEDGLDLSFFAESIEANVRGIENTVFSHDDDKIEEKIEQFEEEFERILKNEGLDIYEARNQVIEKLELKIASLEKGFKKK